MEAQLHKNTKIYVEILSPWREKPRNKLRIISLYKIEITTLRDTIWVKKKKLSFSFHSLLSSSLCIFSYSLYFSLLSSLLSLTQLFKTAPSPHHILGTSLLFPSAQMAEWLLHLFHHLFFLFFLSHSSHQVTINASHLLWLYFVQISFLQLCHSRMTLAFASFFSFFLQRVRHA